MPTGGRPPAIPAPLPSSLLFGRWEAFLAGPVWAYLTSDFDPERFEGEWGQKAVRTLMGGWEEVGASLRICPAWVWVPRWRPNDVQATCSPPALWKGE